jgi:hypothetical protein
VPDDFAVSIFIAPDELDKDIVSPVERETIPPEEVVPLPAPTEIIPPCTAVPAVIVTLPPILASPEEPTDAVMSPAPPLPAEPVVNAMLPLPDEESAVDS